MNTLRKNWFRLRRDELGMSQTDVVHEFYRLGYALTVGSVGGWEKGHPPKFALVDLLAQVYRVTPEKMLTVMYEMSRETRHQVAVK